MDQEAALPHLTPAQQFRRFVTALLMAPEMTMAGRLAGLERQSNDYLQMALASSRADTAAGAAAYQAGYFALLSVLTADEVHQFGDHPNATAASLAAQRLHLMPYDQALASDFAMAYYSPTPDPRRTAALVAWARRVRAAARWGST